MHLPTAVNPSLWLYFTVGVLAFLFVDLFVLNRRPHEVTFKWAVGMSITVLAIGLGFNAWFASAYGSKLGMEFLSGYIVELSLSFDNLFVILMAFKAFKVQTQYQHRVLFWGILGAIVARGVLIVFGSALIHKFEWILYVFGAFLIFTAYKFLFEDEEQQVQIHEKKFVKFLQTRMPITPHMHGEKFFIIEDGIKKATPLFIVLVTVEIADLIFAVDSIPAVLALTKDSFVAYSSNIMAILGLRAFYFLIAGAVSTFRYLKQGLAIILAFVGTKMLIVDWYHVPTAASLLFIIGVLFTSGFLSWFVNRRDKKKH